jgi:hypothetical protein
MSQFEDLTSLNPTEKIAQFSRQPPASTITQDFKQMLFSKDLSDIAFDVEGTVIRAHKLLVVAGSTYFASMLGSGLIESQLDVIPINDMSVEVARAVFEFCYSDDVCFRILYVVADNSAYLF